MNIDLFREKIINQYGQSEFVNIEAGMRMRYSSFRVNTIKSYFSEIEEVLNSNDIEFIHAKWYEDAYVLKNNEDEQKLKELDIYKDGKIYMQSLSSMIPALVLNPQKGENILDMCAAPGGKTTQLAAISNNEAYITACEKNKIRCDRLKYNIQKQGARSINVLMQDSSTLSNYFSFDKILLDTPCSGSGTIRLDMGNKGKITKEYIQKLIIIQRKLIDKAISILKKNGTLVYSTCSIFNEENDDNISYILKKYNDVHLEQISKELLSRDNNQIEFLPTKYDETICTKPNNFYEGFYIAKIVKNS